MKKIKYFILISICVFIGTIFLLIQKKRLIIYWTLNSLTTNTPILSKNNSIQRRVNVYFWKDEKFKNENLTMIWNQENKNETLKSLIDNWISTLYDEKMISKKITVNSVALSTTEQEAYVSFNQDLTWQEWPIIKKWYTIESLLKTVKNANLGIKFISILINNKPLEDSHLNFTQPWPIDGFIIN